MSPTQRALAECKRHGWTAQVVERWNPYAKVRQDLFGCVDIVVLDGAQGLLGIQVTTMGNMASRIKKIQAEPRMAAWLASGARLECWGYSRRGPRGKPKAWALRRVPMNLSQDGCRVVPGESVVASHGPGTATDLAGSAAANPLPNRRQRKGGPVRVLPAEKPIDTVDYYQDVYGGITVITRGDPLPRLPRAKKVDPTCPGCGEDC